VRNPAVVVVGDVVRLSSAWPGDSLPGSLSEDAEGSRDGTRFPDTSFETAFRLPPVSPALAHRPRSLDRKTLQP
jgi:uroporphyrin-III C-methyltransferase/precorrin-2 dehydrogenase/sirohydrochlorin ferrochelatase/uroporphyrin-III C-methyltransferase